MRFPILTSPRRFSISTQVQIVIALFALTNFMKREGGCDEEFYEQWQEEEEEEECQRMSQEQGLTEDKEEDDDIYRAANNAEKRKANAKRDEIANQMWEDYNSILRVQQDRV
jgi:hypothetical protein